MKEVSSKVWFETELGEVGGKDGVHVPGVRTKPAEAAAFVEETSINGFAVAVGSSHAMLDKSSELNFELIADLNDAVSVPLVLHGSSGVSHSDFRKVIAAGIQKINISTELNVVFNDVLKQHIAAGPGDPRKFLVPAREALKNHLVSSQNTCQLRNNYFRLPGIKISVDGPCHHLPVASGKKVRCPEQWL